MKNDMTYLRPYLVLVVLSLVIYLPVSLQASQFLHDYGNHIKLALELPESARRINHVFYHAVFLLAHRLLPSLLLPQAAVAAILTFMLPVPLMAFSIFKKAANQSLPDWLLMAFALGLTVLAPVTIWTNSFMLGYFNPIVYHNPTIIALRLFAIPVSLLAARVFCERPFESMNQQIFLILLCAVLGSGEHRGYNCLSEHVTGFFSTENTEGTEFSCMLGALYHNRLFTTPYPPGAPCWPTAAINC